MDKKIRIRIPKENKIRAVLQQEIDSKCPFCSNIEVGHFEIHHIDENPSNNDIMNLLLLCPICHSKITKGDILIDEVVKIKQGLKNKKRDIQFVSVTTDSDNCGWEPIKGAINAFEVVRYKSLFPIFNFTLINHSDRTAVLTNVELKVKRMPVGLCGPVIEAPSILRPSVLYKIKMPVNDETENYILKDELVVPRDLAFKFQVEVYDESLQRFMPPFNRYALYFKLGFNNDFYIDLPMILLNSDKYYDKLNHVLLG